MRPSETPSGLAWLDNFKEADLAAATVLLDSLRFVGLDTLRIGLVAELEKLEADEGFAKPALLLPERRLKDLGGKSRLNKKTAVAYVDFHPGADISVTPGSEGSVGDVLRDFAEAGRRTTSDIWIAPDAKLKQLRERKCRSIVLVTDYSGTGSQVLTLVETILRNKTIRSWMSLKLIKIHVLAFAASPAAIERLDAHPAIGSVRTVEAAPTFDTAAWTTEVRRAIVALCKRESRESWPLGFSESAGLFATVRRAPNNLPAVFWQKKGGWQALLPHRQVKAAVAADLAGYQPSEPLPTLAARVGQQRVGRNRRLEYMRPESRDLLRVLLSLHRSRRTPAELAAEHGIPMARTKALLRTLRHLHLIDERRKITLMGRREILAQKRALRRTTAKLQGSSTTYYPHSLK